MITCHLINMLKAIQTAGQIAKLEKNNICRQIGKTHMHTHTVTIHWGIISLSLEDAAMNSLSLSLNRLIQAAHNSVQMLKRVEGACMTPNNKPFLRIRRGAAAWTASTPHMTWVLGSHEHNKVAKGLKTVKDCCVYQTHKSHDMTLNLIYVHESNFVVCPFYEP